MTNNTCPCGNTLEYPSCCGLYLDKDQLPATPEALMRSRYTAFTLGRVDYIQSTMQGVAAKHFDPIETTNWLEKTIWSGLRVFRAKLKSDTIGFVTFEASYTYNGQQHTIREKSEFHKLDGKWMYVKGKPLNPNASLS